MPEQPMPTPTDARRDLLTVIAYMHAKPGKEDELRAALEALIKPTSEEDGYVNYDLHQGVEDPGAFFFYENWESADHLNAHLAKPHLQNFSSIAGDLLDEGGLTITRLRRIA
jgi:quinol monooxygenase YgiN